MGLLDILKKKQSKVQTTWEVTTNTNKEYDPWAKTGTSINDDYAIAAFIKISENGAKVGHTNDDYARYFNYEYGVSDPIKYHKNVITNGYLVEATPEVTLGKLKVDQLKIILSNAGLQDKGKKGDLISRIVDNVDIGSLGLEKYYVPSEKGTAHLQKYEYIFRLQRYGISWAEFDKENGKCVDYCKPNDIIWRVLNSRFNDYNINGSYALARNELLCMARLLEDEDKCVDALYRYILVLYYDVSGCGNCYVSNNPEEIELAPGIIESIYRLKDNYDTRIVGRCYDRYRLPHSHISKENFEKLLSDIFEDKAIDIHNYISVKQ